MTANTHRPGINKVFLMSRQLRLEALDSGRADLIVSALNEIAGIDKVSIDEDQCKINLSYDASQVTINHLEKIINQCGQNISRDWWTQLKRGWYQFTDSNSMSNARSIPGCCNKPPQE